MRVFYFINVLKENVGASNSLYVNNKIYIWENVDKYRRMLVQKPKDFSHYI